MKYKWWRYALAAIALAVTEGKESTAEQGKNEM